MQAKTLEWATWWVHYHLMAGYVSDIELQMYEIALAYVQASASGFPAVEPDILQDVRFLQVSQAARHGSQPSCMHAGVIECFWDSRDEDQLAFSFRL